MKENLRCGRRAGIQLRYRGSGCTPSLTTSSFVVQLFIVALQTRQATRSQLLEHGSAKNRESAPGVAASFQRTIYLSPMPMASIFAPTLWRKPVGCTTVSAISVICDQVRPIRRPLCVLWRTRVYMSLIYAFPLRKQCAIPIIFIFLFDSDLHINSNSNRPLD